MPISYHVFNENLKPSKDTHLNAILSCKRLKKYKLPDETYQKNFVIRHLNCLDCD